MGKRAVLIVLDSVGIGAMPDAADFGDTGSHTLGNILANRGTLNIPNLYAMGLGNITDSRLPKAHRPTAAYGRAAESTHAKDTTCGHWELAGLPLEQPLRTYPNGFPEELIKAFEVRIQKGTLCNRPASGTVIINELGDAHVQTGKPIVYTSADSVFQIAAHEDVIPLNELYSICEIAREMLVGEYLVGRVIARPFSGSAGNYTRTKNRKDYSIEPPEDTILDGLIKEGFTTAGIGKIEDIFCSRGLTLSDHTHNNHEGIDATLRFIREKEFDFLFVNLVDFDMLYGHRNDVEGYARALEEFDRRLPEIFMAMGEEDVLLLTADHGCDPTTVSTDHSREYIPLLAYGKPWKPGISLGTRDTFSDVGATIYQYITGKEWPRGTSFLQDVKKE